MTRSAHAVFCDDIRHEVSGKYTLSGVYGETLLASSFPLVLPKLCLMLYTLTPMPWPLQRLQFQVFLGDKALAKAEVSASKLAEIAQSAARVEADMNSPTPLQRIATPLSFNSLTVPAPCLLRIRVVTESGELPVNALRLLGSTQSAISSSRH